MGVKRKLASDSNRPLKKPRSLTRYQQSQVSRIVNRSLDVKHWDINIASNPLVWTLGEATQNLTAIPRSDVNRIGDSIKLLSIRFALSFKYPDSATIPQDQFRPQKLRCIFYIWRPNTAFSGNPNLTQILAASSTKDIQPYSWVNRKQFKILHDETIVVGGYTDSAIQQRIIRMKIPQKYQELTYGSDNTTIVGESHVFVSFYMDLRNASEPAQNNVLTYTSRCFYHDS